MTNLFEISISVALILFVVFELIKINILKNDSESLATTAISLFLILFGLYVSFKYGLIVDYGTAEEIKTSHAEPMSYLGAAGALIGSVAILIAITKFIVWEVKRRIPRNERH